MYSRRLTYSEVRYGYLRIIKDYSDQYPNPGENIRITCNNYNELKTMHSSQSGRIDGLTRLYKDNKIRPGDIALLSFKDNGIHISFSEGESVFEKTESTKGYSSLQLAILRAQELISTKAYLFCNNETNVRTEIIEPILKTLDWNLPSLAREKKCAKSKRKVDYALYKNNSCVLIIEAKSLDTPLPEEACVSQLTNYLKDDLFSNAEFGVLTNGQVWQIRDKEKLTISKSIDILNATDEEKGIKDIEDFFLLFHNSSFDSTVIKNAEEKVHFTSDDRTKHFKIIDNYTKEEIKKSDPTKTFRAFIDKHINDVIDLQTSNCFNITVLTEEKDNVRNPKQSDNNRKYYITGDYSTYQKRMIIQQIIDRKKLDVHIETI